MVVMWALMILVWRMLTKVLRRAGRWALVVPTAVVGVALFALNTWTAATVLFALLLAVLLSLILVGRRSASTSSLIPVTMLGAGLCGLWAGATMAGSWVQGRSFTIWNALVPMQKLAKAPPGKSQGVVPGPLANPPAVFSSPNGQVTFNLANPAQAKANMAAQATKLTQQAQVNYIAKAGGPPPFPRKFFAGPGGPRSITFGPGGSRTVIFGPGGQRKVIGSTGRVTQVIVNGHGLMWGRLLILGSLLLLALGIWLAPRAVSDLRDQYAKVAPHVKGWLREGNWGILLVPVTAFGMTMFGVRPWTVAAIIVAVVISIRWPKLAGDLVPLMLVGFALYGFMLASRWMPGPPGSGFTPQATQFGVVPVDSSATSLLAGVEASVLLAFGAWLFPRTIGAHARGKDASGRAELAGRVQRLTETRNQAVDAAAAELRRIERDLHDGTQARLVALGMNLRALERMLPASEPGALALVAEARDTSLRALNDLRHLVRGIYPPVLADRGLAHAVEALALDTPMPVELDIDLPGRLSAPVESACYFAVAEILANAVKHSGAHRVHIRMQHRDNVLRIEVADDGTGGADPSAGTGLRGVERRLGTFDGILAVSSPVGGPTMIAMEVPCALSSQKTSSS
jgi:signal transduction histidine kinase